MRHLLSVVFLTLAVSFSFLQDSSANQFDLKHGDGENHDHTENVCVQGNVKVCAHLKFLSKIDSSNEGQFMAHILAPGNQEVQNLKIDLWMDMGAGHGHGSAPVDVQSLGKNKFKVTNAWFVMMGQWLVRLNFTIGQDAYEIHIPVNVNE